MSIRPGRLAQKIAAISLAVICALPVAAQTPAPVPPVTPLGQTPGQTPGQAPAPDAQIPRSRPIPQRTSGLQPGNVVRWTLRDAVMAALDKNVDIEIERENVRLAQFDISGAKGVYDPAIGADISYESLKSPNAFLFSGTAQNFVLRDTLQWNFTAQQLVEKGGGNYFINMNNSRVGSNTQNFTPQFNPNLTIQYTQPLFKNFSVDGNRRAIKIAKKQLDLSDALFRQRAIDIISQVQRAYWDLALAIRDEEIQRDAVALAETQLHNNQRQVEVGTLAPIDVVSAAAQLESRRQQAFQAIQAVGIAENSLKALTVESATSQLWSAQILPVEPFEIQHVALPLQDALKLAVENRPELKQYALQKEMNDIDVDYFKNQLKPQIDVVGSYRMTGLAGSPRPGVPPGQIFPEFVGGYGTALSNLIKNDFRTWSVGLQFTFPLRNRVAKANYGRALETERKLDLQTRSQLQTIEVEVRNAVQAVETAQYRIEASRLAREYAQQQLDGEMKKFQAGMIANFFVLTRQNELAAARGVEQRALADYNKAVADLQRVISTTLSSNNIEIRSAK